jgi:hypothetical protein
LSRQVAEKHSQYRSQELLLTLPPSIFRERSSVFVISRQARFWWLVEFLNILGVCQKISYWAKFSARPIWGELHVCEPDIQVLSRYYRKRHWAAIYVQALTTEKAKIVVVHRGLCRLLGLLLPMLLATAAAPELISVTLGPKWEELSFLLRLFFPLYVFNAICGQTEPVLLAFGPFDIAFWCIVG